VKAQASLITKAVFIILAMVIVSFVSYQLFSFTFSSQKIKEHEELLLKANDILQTLISSYTCLAYKDLGKIESYPKEFSTQKIVDMNKLNDFTTRFFDVQPECARDFNIGYRIKVETFPINISAAKPGPTEDVFGKIFRLIDGKKVVFSLDVSGSMGDPAGKCDVDPNHKNSKICCLKKFMYGFIDEMKPESKIAVNVFGTFNAFVKWIITPLIEIDDNRIKLKSYIEPLIPEDSTPMCIGLEEAFKLAITENAHAIVLLTDGNENVGCERKTSVQVAQDYSSYKIPVYTVGFGSGANMQILEDVARITGGDAFYAETCEELISEEGIKNVSIPSYSWEFGNMNFSEEDALKEEARLSFPVIVAINSSTFLPGIIQIRVVSGDLEKLRGGIESSCLTNLDKSSYYEFSYPITIKSEKVCMRFKRGEVCQKLTCKKYIEPKTIQPGKYYVTFRNLNNKLEVLV